VQRQAGGGRGQAAREDAAQVPPEVRSRDRA